MDWKGFGRKRSLRSRNTAPALFSGGDDGEGGNDEYLWIAGVPAKSRCWHLSNANTERHHYTEPASYTA
jgi:hypothetical protein